MLRMFSGFWLFCCYFPCFKSLNCWSPYRASISVNSPRNITFAWLCVALHMLSLPLCIRTVSVQLSAEKRIVVFYPLSLTAIILSGAESCSQHDLPAPISSPSQQQQRYMEPIERPASTLRIQSAVFSSNYTSFLFCLPLMPLMASKAVFPSPLSLSSTSLHF